MEYLSMYTLYDHPSDFPDFYVVRRWQIGPNKEVIPDEEIFLKSKNLSFVHDTMESVHGRIFLSRNEEDDPCIMGTYL